MQTEVQRSEAALEKLLAGGVCDLNDLACVLRTADLIPLGLAAGTVQRRLHPDDVVTYLVDCTVTLGPRDTPAALAEAVSAARDQARGDGGLDQVLLQADAVDPASVPAFLQAAGALGVPAVGLDTPLVLAAAAAGGGDAPDILARWQAAGLAVLHASPVAGFLPLLQAAARIGLPVAVPIPFQAGEPAEDAVRRLLAVRSAQEETGALVAAIPLVIDNAPDPAPLGYRYLKWVALCRLVLQNVAHLQVSPVTQGGRVAQVALGCGGSDFGGTQTQFQTAELTVGRTGPMAVAELERWIRDAGCTPARRTATYARAAH